MSPIDYKIKAETEQNHIRKNVQSSSKEIQIILYMSDLNKDHACACNIP